MTGRLLPKQTDGHLWFFLSSDILTGNLSLKIDCLFSHLLPSFPPFRHLNHPFLPDFEDLCK